MNNKFWRITLDTTPEDCNLHCIMCEEHSEFSDFKQKLFAKTGVKRRVMPKEWIHDILLEAKDLGVKEIIPTTMGDPLVSDTFEWIVNEAKQLGLKLNITHNGTFPRKSVSDWAKLIIPVTSDIKISWNGATKTTSESVMKGIDFDKAVENIKIFITYRNLYFQQTGYYCRVTFQLTFLQNNMHELNDIIRMAAALDVDRIKGHHLWVHFAVIEKLSFENTKESKTQWNELVKSAMATAEKFRKPNGKMVVLENFYHFDIDNVSIENHVPEDYECPFLEKELWISATGKISPCCAPDEKRNVLGDFGNYPQNKLKNVLQSDIYKQLVLNYKKNKLCQTCVMRRKP